MKLSFYSLALSLLFSMDLNAACPQINGSFDCGGTNPTIVSTYVQNGKNYIKLDHALFPADGSQVTFPDFPERKNVTTSVVCQTDQSMGDHYFGIYNADGYDWDNVVYQGHYNINMYWYLDQNNNFNFDATGTFVDTNGQVTHINEQISCPRL